MKNAVIEALKKSPCIRSELPYAAVVYKMNEIDRGTVRKIKVPGRRGTKRPKFLTVYYLEGDEDRAAEKFVEVNIDSLAMLRWDGFNALNSSIDRGILDRLKKALL